jgi:hypothetical protein
MCLSVAHTGCGRYFAYSNYPFAKRASGKHGVLRDSCGTFGWCFNTSFSKCFLKVVKNGTHFILGHTWNFCFLKKGREESQGTGGRREQVLA